MNTRLYVGNLSNNALESDLEGLFASHGLVADVNIMTDITGQSRGFAFVTMSTWQGANTALDALDGMLWNGRDLDIIKVQSREHIPYTAAEVRLFSLL